MIHLKADNKRGIKCNRWNQGFINVSDDISKVSCKTCKGAGRVRGRERLEFDLPAGVEEGAELSLKGKGQAGFRAATPGDHRGADRSPVGRGIRLPSATGDGSSASKGGVEELVGAEAGAAAKRLRKAIRRNDRHVVSLGRSW